jgi:hypothetical protein
MYRKVKDIFMIIIDEDKYIFIKNIIYIIKHFYINIVF